MGHFWRADPGLFWRALKCRTEFHGDERLLALRNYRPLRDVFALSRLSIAWVLGNVAVEKCVLDIVDGEAIVGHLLICVGRHDVLAATDRFLDSPEQPFGNAWILPPIGPRRHHAG